MIPCHFQESGNINVMIMNTMCEIRILVAIEQLKVETEPLKGHSTPSSAKSAGWRGVRNLACLLTIQRLCWNHGKRGYLLAYISTHVLTCSFRPDVLSKKLGTAASGKRDIFWPGWKAVETWRLTGQQSGFRQGEYYHSCGISVACLTDTIPIFSDFIRVPTCAVRITLPTPP